MALTRVRAHPRKGSRGVRKHSRAVKAMPSYTQNSFFGNLFRDKTPAEKQAEIRIKARRAAEAESAERSKERLEDEAERLEERKLEKKLRREQLTESIDKSEAESRLYREEGRGKVGKLI